MAGLDIGASSIKFIRLEDRPDGYALTAAGTRELPPEALVAEEIKDREAIILNIQSLIDACDPKTREVFFGVKSCNWSAPWPWRRYRAVGELGQDSSTQAPIQSR